MESKSEHLGRRRLRPSVKWWKEVEENGQFNRTVVSVERVDAASGAVKLIFDSGEQLTAWFRALPS